MDGSLDLAIPCPRCSYRNALDAHHCGMCGYVPPRVAADEEVPTAESRPGTAAFRRPPVGQPGTAAINKPTDRLSKATTASMQPITGRIDRTARTTPSGGQPVLPAEILAMRSEERRKNIKRTVYSTGRFIRHALVGVIALGALCVARESAYSLTAFTTNVVKTDAAELAVFSLLFGLPIGFITAWHGGGAYRGLFVAGGLFAVEPLVIGRFMGPGHLAAWSFTDLIVGLLAGFCVGLFIEIDR